MSCAVMRDNTSSLLSAPPAALKRRFFLSAASAAAAAAASASSAAASCWRAAEAVASAPRTGVPPMLFWVMDLALKGIWKILLAPSLHEGAIRIQAVVPGLHVLHWTWCSQRSVEFEH